MNRRKLIIASLSVCMLTVAGTAGADGKLLKPEGGYVGIRPGFTVTGLFSGVMSGTVLIGDDSVEITPLTKIWSIGGGEMNLGDEVRGSSVIAAGYRRGDKMMATFVVVSKPNSGLDFSETTLPNAVLPPKTPR